MKVLHVINDMDPRQGGVSQAVRTIVMSLSKIGTQNEVACLNAPNASFLAKETFPVHTLGPSKGPWSYSKRLMPWLVEHLPVFDVVILHGLWLYSGYALHKAIRLVKKQKEENIPAFYIMPHGMLDPYFQNAPGRKLKALRNFIYWKLVEGKVVNGAAGLLFTCEEERRLAHKPFKPYKPKLELIVGLGVEEPPVFTPAMQDAFLQQCPVLQDKAYILFLSRIHEKKGVDLLLKAYAEVVRLFEKFKEKTHSLAGMAVGDKGKVAFIDIAFPKLVIAGPGLDTPYGERVQQMVSGSEELKCAVVFPGMLSGDAKWGAFYGCEAFVLPSHQENFGIAVVEALACGKPVLISNQVNIWREIKASGGGMVADDTLAGAKELLQGWLSLLHCDKQTMRQQARSAYEKHFAIGPAAEKLLKALTEQ